MRVLLDESIPRRFGFLLTGHYVRTVQHCGWSGLKNGELLRVAQADFDVLVTADQNMQYQQLVLQAHACSENLEHPELRSQAGDLIVIHKSSQSKNTVIPAGMLKSSAMDGNSSLRKCLIYGMCQCAGSHPCDWIPAVHAGMTGFDYLRITMGARTWERVQHVLLFTIQ